MHGSIILNAITCTLMLFVIMDNDKVFACSPPDHRVTRSFRARAHDAEMVVFATVLQTSSNAKLHLRRYYSAHLTIHCILKGPSLPRVIKVYGFGNDGGGCTRTDAVAHKSYIILIRKFQDRYYLHNVEISTAAKKAREKLLLRMLPEFWSTAHRPYRKLGDTSRFTHCPNLKKMKRILRKSMRKYIRSKPELSKKRQQLEDWLKKHRLERKEAKNARKTDLITISTTLTNSVKSLYTLEANQGLYTSDSYGVKRKRSGLVRRSNTEFTEDKANYAGYLNSAKAVSISFWSIGFAWLMICLLQS